MVKHAIFLDGPIGAGKTTLRRALAGRLSGGFIDGDDHSDPDRPWYCSILGTSRSIVRTGLTLLQGTNVVVVAYPLDCMSWIYLRRRLAEGGARPIFVGLRATYGGIVDARRGRTFYAGEHARIRAMIAQGYGNRAFSDLVVDTDRASFADNLSELDGRIRGLLVL